MAKVIPGTDLPIATQKRLLRMNKKGQSWRAIGEMYGVNQKYVYDWAVHGIVPTCPEVCYRMGLMRRPKPAWLKQAVEALQVRDRGEPIEGPRVYARGGRLVKS
jgi:hypothetical protein